VGRPLFLGFPGERGEINARISVMGAIAHIDEIFAVFMGRVSGAGS
jgi:hypothetical protein